MIDARKRCMLAAMLMLAALTGCGDEADTGYAERAIEAHRKVAEMREELAHTQQQLMRREREIEYLKEALAASKGRAESADIRAHNADLRASSEQLQRRNAENQADKAQQDFHAATVIGFSSVLGAILLSYLMLRERRRRAALTRFLRWLKGRISA